MQRNRPPGIDSVVLHLGVERRGFHLQELRCSALIAATVAKCALDQLHLIPLNLVIKIDDNGRTLSRKILRWNGKMYRSFFQAK